MTALIWKTGCPDPKPDKPLYVKPQPAVYLNDPNELLLAIEEAADCSSVYIRNPGKGNGYTCIDYWYAKALYERIK